MKTLIILISLAFCSLNFSDTVAQGFNQEYLESTVLIIHKNREGKKAKGTGIIVFYKKDYFLVTNKHLLPNKDDYQKLLIRTRKKVRGNIVFGDIEIDYLGDNNEYAKTVLFHGNPRYDITVINITNTIRREFLDIIALPGSLFASKKIFEDANILVGTEVFIVGYPVGLHDFEKITPVLMKGIIASDPQVVFTFSNSIADRFKLPKKLDGFLVDANVLSGSSGSMVVLKRQDFENSIEKGKLSKDVNYFLGIISHTISEKGYGIGLGVVYSSNSIKEIFDDYYKK